MTKPNKVPIAVAKALQLRQEQRQKLAAERRQRQGREVVYNLCDRLSRKKTLEAMQTLVDTFTDSRADALCNEILAATNLEDAARILTRYRRPKKNTIVIEHCIEQSTGKQRHVFRLRYWEQIPLFEVCSASYIEGWNMLEEQAPKHRCYNLGDRNFITQTLPPWPPYDMPHPASQQKHLKNVQRMAGPNWHVCARAS